MQESCYTYELQLAHVVSSANTCTSHATRVICQHPNSHLQNIMSPRIMFLLITNPVWSNWSSKHGAKIYVVCHVCPIYFSWSACWHDQCGDPEFPRDVTHTRLCVWCHTCTSEEPHRVKDSFTESCEATGAFVLPVLLHSVRLVTCTQSHVRLLRVFHSVRLLTWKTLSNHETRREEVEKVVCRLVRVYDSSDTLRVYDSCHATHFKVINELNESCHTCTSHATRVKESCRTRERVMPHTWRSHITDTNAWLPPSHAIPYQPPADKIHVTHLNESCYRYERPSAFKITNASPYPPT